MKLGWYHALSIREKQSLCELLHDLKGVNCHPGSLPFIKQATIAVLVLENPRLGLCMKLYDTCGECGKPMSGDRFHGSWEHSSGWLCWCCRECSLIEVSA